MDRQSTAPVRRNLAIAAESLPKSLPESLPWMTSYTSHSYIGILRPVL